MTATTDDYLDPKDILAAWRSSERTWGDIALFAARAVACVVANAVMALLAGILASDVIAAVPEIPGSVAAHWDALLAFVSSDAAAMLAIAAACLTAFAAMWVGASLLARSSAASSTKGATISPTGSPGASQIGVASDARR